MKRVGKYEGKTNDTIETVISNAGDELIRNAENDNEIVGKNEICEKIVNQLHEYCDEMSLSILKNLTLSFKSKANDRRVIETCKQYGISGYTKEEFVEEAEKEPYVAPESSVKQETIQVNAERISPDTIVIDDIHTFIKDCLTADGPKKCEIHIKPINVQSIETTPIEVENEPPTLIVVPEQPMKRKRGRPKGSKNKVKTLIETEYEQDV